MTALESEQSQPALPGPLPLAEQKPATKEAPAPLAAWPYVAALFFISGATALAVQVVFGRLLTYIFGASHLATATVLAAYMAGLTAGTFVAGRFTSRLKRPILTYGFIELSVGLMVCLLPALFGYFQSAGVALSRTYVEQPVVLTLVRFAFSFVLVFLPTLLMGATLPILVSAFREGDAIKRRLPALYAVNTLGAAFGALLCGYVLIHSFGLDGTLYLCSLFNLLIAVSSFAISRKTESAAVAAPDAAAASSPIPPVEAVIDAEMTNTLSPQAVCALAFGQGFLTFTLEVVWFHLIGTVIGVTTYAFSIMLTVILLGIGLGSLLLPWLQRRLKLSPVTLFVWSEIVMAAGVVASLWLWDRFPDVVGFTLTLSDSWTFYGREAVRFAFTLALLLPATLAMGIALPAITAAARNDAQREDSAHAGAWVSLVFGTNTVGTILGSLICGFVLLGRVSSSTIFAGVAAGSVVLAYLAYRLSRTAPEPRGAVFVPWRLAAIGTMIALLFFPGWDVQRLTAGSHYYWTARPAELPEISFLKEDAQSGFITVERVANGGRVMRTNGKYEGSDTPGEFQELFALLGCLYAKNFNNAALIGLGPGRTLALLHALPYRNIEVAEFSPAVIEAARTQFPDVAGAAMDDVERVRVICDDGRHHLQLSGKTYDYIGVGITGAAFAGITSLYSRDFLSLARSRLAPRGLFMLWLQIHHVFDYDARSVIATVRSVFPFVHFYAHPDGTQGFVLASAEPLTVDLRALAELGRIPAIQSAVRASGFGSLAALISLNIFSTDAELRNYFGNTSISRPPRLLTDFDPALEYSTPYALATIIGGYNFQGLSAQQLPPLEPAPLPEHRAGLQGLRYLIGKEYRKALECFEQAEKLSGQPQWSSEINYLRQVLAHPMPPSQP